MAANNRSSADGRVVTALIYKESRFYPLARNTDPNSSATGLMQMTRTALSEVNRVRRTQYQHGSMTIASSNIEAGTTYLSICLERRPTLAAALDYYGTGPGYSGPIIRAADRLASASDPMAVLVESIGR